MSEKVLSLEGDHGETILLELSDTSSEFGYRGDQAEGAPEVKKVHKAFAQALAPIRSIANNTLQNVRLFADSPEEVTLEMGVKINGEAKAVITKIGGEAHFKVTIKWTQDSINNYQKAQQTDATSS